MADKSLVLESYLSCHVCSQTFRDPVSLCCDHSFCSDCLQKFWERAQNRNCPICKRKSSKDDPGVNCALKEVADCFAGRQKSESAGTEEAVKKEEVVCQKHREETFQFCVDEQRAVCPVCEASLHQNHKLVPVEEGVRQLKELLESHLKSLQDKRNKCEQADKTYSKVIEHSKKQLLSAERQIRPEFNRLQQFLKEEEESRLTALREEEEQRRKTVSREMKMMEQQISSLSESICSVEEELQKRTMLFLSGYKPTLSRARVQRSVSDPQLVCGALTDVAKHLGNLSFRVREKMKVHFSPVILDQNTSHGRLHLSDDLTSVRHGDTEQQLPDKPERFTKYNNVLRSEGFSSGRHSWEVEVGDHPDWYVSLAKESANRKEKISALPNSGIWCLSHQTGEYLDVAGKTVPVKKSLPRIRVQLDYDRGEVSFYDAGDGTPIYTHRDTFTEKLFPFFSVGRAGDAQTADVKICPTVLSL